MFITYYDISYHNLIYIVGPILATAFVFSFLLLTTKRRFDPVIANINLHENIAVVLAFISAAIMASEFDFLNFLLGNLDEIRGEYLYREVTVWAQIAPLLLVYPLIYISFRFLKTSPKMGWKSILILFFLIFFGVSTGGRAFVFEILLLFIFIARPNIFSFKYILTFGLIFWLFAYITLGRYQNISSFKANLLEASAPLKFNKFLKDRSEYPEAKDIFIEFVFYFGQGVPAFCNKFDNLEMTILPRATWGVQPFVERQLYRLGFIDHTQKEMYNSILDLSEGSGFFRVSWSTGFLDLYFYEGMLLSIFIYLFIAVILFITHRNLIRTQAPKFKVLTGFNLLFILTMFMTPAFSETVAFFSYVTIFLTKIKID